MIFNYIFTALILGLFYGSIFTLGLWVVCSPIYLLSKPQNKNDLEDKQVIFFKIISLIIMLILSGSALTLPLFSNILRL